MLLSRAEHAPATTLPVVRDEEAEEVAGFKRWGRGGGVSAATFRTAPRPPTLTRYRIRTRTALMARQDLACSRSPLEMLGYLQPRDFDVHGVAHVRANDLANRGTGHSMTTSDNRARPARRSRRELTRADLARHVEGDYRSNVRPCLGRREKFLYCIKALGLHAVPYVGSYERLTSRT